MKNVILGFFLIGLSACQTETKFVVHTANDLYSMEIPEYMETGNFPGEASMEFVNNEKEMYAIAMEESKESHKEYDLQYDLETYFKITARSFDSVNTIKPVQKTINGLPASQSEIKGKINGHNVKYYITVLESPTYFYRVIFWSHENKYDAAKKDFDHMVNSFKEIKKKGA